MSGSSDDFARGRVYERATWAIWVSLGAVAVTLGKLLIEWWP